MPRVGIRIQIKAEVKLGIDARQIVQAALHLLDEVGLDNLTMRRLAERLNIKAASLYWHVRDKEELMALLANEICAEARLPDPSMSWQEQMKWFADDYRRVLLSHRDGARVLLLSGAPSGAVRLDLVEMMFGSLVKIGFRPQDAVFAGMLLNDYVTAFVVEETRYLVPPGDQKTGETSPENWIDSLPRDQYPTIAALAPYLIHIDMGEQFRFGMQVILDGLEKRLAAKE